MRPRLVLAGAALLTGATLALLGILSCPGNEQRAAVELAVAGVLLLLAALTHWPVLLAPALAGVALPIALAVVARPERGAIAIAGAALLVATGELAGWSLERRSVVAEERDVTAARTVTTIGLVAGAAPVSAVVLAVSGLPAPPAFVALVAGVGATLAIVAFVALRQWE